MKPFVIHEEATDLDRAAKLFGLADKPSSDGSIIIVQSKSVYCTVSLRRSYMDCMSLTHTPVRSASPLARKLKGLVQSIGIDSGLDLGGDGHLGEGR